MYKLSKPFEKAIRGLKPPTSKDFDSLLWEKALRDNPHAGPQAERLVKTAVWIADKFASARSRLTTLELDTLNSKWRILLAVASVNREFRTGKALLREQLEADDSDSLILDDLSNKQIRGGAGVPLGVDDANETSIDAIESWIYDALQTPGTSEPTGDLTVTAIKGIRAYTWRKAMNALWNDARHQGWFVEESDAAAFWRPSDHELEKLIAACLQRQQLNLLNFPTVDRQAWPLLSPASRRQLSMPKSVIEAVRRGVEVNLKSGQLPHLSRHLPPFVVEKGGLEGSYLAEFLDTKMPLHQLLTPMLVLRAWHVIRDAAEAIERITPLTTTLDAKSVMTQSLVVQRARLRAALEKSLRIDRNCAETLIDFLVYYPASKDAKGHKGLWAAPLVPIPTTDLIALPLTALLTSNPLRRMEAWLERGGIDDSNAVTSRGDQYEASYRKSICEAVATNPTFVNAACAPNGIKSTAAFPEQIDLLIAFGGLCLVGEVKFFLTPADPHERARYFGKLEDAAQQAVRKAAALDARRDIVAKALGTDEDAAKALELRPIVVTNQGFAFSLEVNGARVVDAKFLLTYLSGDDMVSGMAYSTKQVKAATSTVSFYSSEVEAARRFDTEMRAPYVLTRHLERVKFRSTLVPMPKGPPLAIISPFVDDMSGLELAQAKSLIGRVNG
ncbi:hypothetical protein [Reyranella sp.]|uniref:hypothetical protein n=1 Tax=Reyranella sp. TaxID=1929291 RepID=UPI003D0EB39C